MYLRMMRRADVDAVLWMILIIPLAEVAKSLGPFLLAEMPQPHRFAASVVSVNRLAMTVWFGALSYSYLGKIELHLEG